MPEKIYNFQNENNGREEQFMSESLALGGCAYYCLVFGVYIPSPLPHIFAMNSLERTQHMEIYVYRITHVRRS